MKKNYFGYYTLILITIGCVTLGCTKTCDIKLKNGTAGEIKVLIKGANSGDEKTYSLKPGEDFKVGQCTDCSAIEEDEIDATAMLVSLGLDELELKDKKEVAKFLNELKLEGCVVKVFE